MRLLELYVDLVRGFGRRAVLLPAGDRNVRFIAEHRAIFAKHYAFRIGDHGLLDVISSKRAFVAVAERHGLPLPPTILPGSREELSRDRRPVPARGRHGRPWFRLDPGAAHREPRRPGSR